MSRQFLYRNVHARDHLELFLVSAASSLLLLRFFLYLAGYPQVGGGSLHIAHMLYGGLLLLAAVVLVVSFLGARIQQLASVIGGIGFGIFIDELGKFITKDNNYFFRPTIGIIYALFMILYLLFNFLSRTQGFTSREYQLNALLQLDEAVEHDLDPHEKARIAELLTHADQKDPLTRELQKLLKRIDTVPVPQPNRFRRWLESVTNDYERFWRRDNSGRLVGGLFVFETVVFVVTVILTLAKSFGSFGTLFQVHNSYDHNLIIGQLITSFVAAGFAIIGAIKLPVSRLQAFEWFRRATLVNLFLTQFFVFTRLQFGAIPGFLINLILLIGLRYAIAQESRLTLKK